jgi:hypothetical protein
VFSGRRQREDKAAEMIAIESARARGLASIRLAACAAALLLGGCVSYSPAQLSAMQTVDLCETIDVQSYNLSPDARSGIQGELARRNESCAKYGEAVAQRRQDFLDRETYGKQSP